ncbi:unnamed protein product, partial [Musa hybrid cultivar]
IAASSSSFSAFASLSKRLICRGPPLCRQILLPSASRFSSTSLSSPDESDSTSEGGTPRSEETTPPSPSSGAADATAASEAPQRRAPFQRPLESGLDQGVYKAVVVGKVGQQPVQKYLRSGRAVVLFSLGTGGIRNNRRPLENEEPSRESTPSGAPCSGTGFVCTLIGSAASPLSTSSL